MKEHLNRHELQRFYSLRHISSELGRGRAWLRCALNEHSLERYLHSLLADHPRLGLVDWVTFVSDCCCCCCASFMQHLPRCFLVCLSHVWIHKNHSLYIFSQTFLFIYFAFSYSNVALFFFLETTMRTGLSFSMKRGQACSPPWLQVSIFMLNVVKFLIWLSVICMPVQTHSMTNDTAFLKQHAHHEKICWR